MGCRQAGRRMHAALHTEDAALQVCYFTGQALGLFCLQQAEGLQLILY